MGITFIVSWPCVRTLLTISTLVEWASGLSFDPPPLRLVPTFSTVLSAEKLARFSDKIALMLKLEESSRGINRGNYLVYLEKVSRGERFTLL